MLAVENLQIGYKEGLLSTPISNKWNKEEVVVLLGDNGVGKSTLLKTLAGLHQPLKGFVELETQKIGWVDSSISKGVYLSVEDFLSFGVDSTLEEKQSWLKKFNLRIELDRFIDELSDGQFRKLCIIRQLLKKPEVLFLDEPTVYLDVSSKNILIDVIKTIKEDCLIFCSTHDLIFAEEIKTSTVQF